jgi:hypothetical protein
MGLCEEAVDNWKTDNTTERETMTTETVTYKTIAENASIDPEAFEAFCDNQHITVEDAEDAVSDFQEAYIGQCENAEDFIRDYLWETEGLSAIPSNITNHVDWDEVWECEYRHYYYEIDGHYFRNI